MVVVGCCATPPVVDCPSQLTCFNHFGLCIRQLCFLSCQSEKTSANLICLTSTYFILIWLKTFAEALLIRDGGRMSGSLFLAVQDSSIGDIVSQ